MIKATIRAASILTASIGTFLHAQTFETLHQFSAADGAEPATAMTVGPDGALWGVTQSGGTNGVGVIYRYSLDQIDPGFHKIHDFNPMTTGRHPVARLLNIGDGNLYGASFSGLADQTYKNTGGAVFKIGDPGLPTQEVSVIHGIPATALTPYKATYLTSGEPGVLHVVCEDYSGVRRVPVNPPGAVTFPPVFPSSPKPSSVIRASNGFLYGTSYGGTSDVGSLFRLDPNGNN